MECSDWPITYPCDVAGEDPTLLASAASAAQSILWSLSGRRYGTCETTEEYRLPCAQGCLPFDRAAMPPGVEYRFDPEPRKCCRLHLAQGPTRAVLEVYENGVLLDPSEYVLERGYVLRVGTCWACEDDCDLAPISIRYVYGIDVPDLGRLAMGELTCELLAGWTGADCRLPSNAISVTRQGVTVDLGNPEILFEQNRLGLPICDAFLRSVNPGKLWSASKVYSVDLARRAR